MNIFELFFGRKKVKAEDQNKEKQAKKNYDPLDALSRGQRQEWRENQIKNPIPVSIDDYPLHIPRLVMDSAESPGTVKNVSAGGGNPSSYGVPEMLQMWYNSQGFIGYQACALIAQHWLVDKACSQAGEDALRNGWEIKTGGQKIQEETLNQISEIDKTFNLKENLAELNRFKNIFGVRVAIFEVDSDDPNYYENEFNIDGVTEGSYLGISQVDPYWMTPMLTAESTSNPAGRHFYEPEYWIISGKKYHRSHLIIARGPQPADILKPTYIFGGIPLVQRIYERVYAAERTANEAPLLSLSKRTTAIHVDVEKAMTNEAKFTEKLMFWTRFRDNHAVKVLGKDESMEQYDTNLSDFDSIIMNQYQLVAAICKTPATKLLGTSPKGFNATGEFESISYHEELESLQEHVYDPMLTRHYMLLTKSKGLDISLEIVWNPVDSITTQGRAELNDAKAETDQKYITMGAVSPDEVRQRLRNDDHSGYNNLTDDEANEEPGMSPENIAAFEKAGADKEKAGAAVETAGAVGVKSNAQAGAINNGMTPTAAGVKSDDLSNDEETPTPAPAVHAGVPKANPQTAQLRAVMKGIVEALAALEDRMTPEGEDLEAHVSPGVKRSVLPTASGIDASTVGAGAIVPPSDPANLKRIKMGGLINVIENPRGSIRQGKNGDWQQKMPHHYGFIKGTQGADGDEMDCFIGHNLKSKKVFVVNQNKQDGTFDEHKVMLGFDGPTAAKDAYHAAYSKDWTGFGSMHPMDMGSFKQWLNKGDTKNPVGKV